VGQAIEYASFEGESGSAYTDERSEPKVILVKTLG
jgi:hypothetical protein